VSDLINVQHFINNEFVDASDGRTFDRLNPAINQPFARVASGSGTDVDAAVAAARAAFAGGPWPRLPIAQRAKCVRRIGELIEKHAAELVRLEILDSGVPISQIKDGTIPRSAYNFHFFADLLPQLVGEAFPVDGRFLNYTVRKPVGVAGLITPWNIPFMQETWKVAPALAGGNTVILKPAEWAPLTAHKLAEIIQEADLPPGVFNVVHGYGETAGAPLVAHPGVQLISFTGETTTGMEIMRNGAATLKRLSMELGGKSPNIVFADAELERALDGALFQVYSLNGERCTAASRLLVQDTIYDELVSRLEARVRAIRIGDPTDPATEIGPLIHPDHWQRVSGYMDVARAEGATVRVGGGRPARLPDGNYFEPTLITEVRNDMRVAQEEIFGPVLVVMPFHDETEALRLANAVRYGLAAYIWTRDLGRGHRMGQALEAGLVWINSQNVRDLRTPFGGAKHSGIGREGGRYSFDFYTELTTIHVALGEHPLPRLGADG
jgi:5-carboxymethyl-2-hydroxymuconic-semialdehyde dehydrogenase